MQYLRTFTLFVVEKTSPRLSPKCEFINPSETGRDGGKRFSAFSLIFLKPKSVIKKYGQIRGYRESNYNQETSLAETNECGKGKISI